MSGGGVIPVFASEATGGTVTAGATASESYSETGNQNCEVTVNIGSKFTVTIPKKITLSGADGVSAYNVTAKGSIGALECIEVVPDEDFNLKSAGKADVLTTVTQTKTSFDYADACKEENGVQVGTTAEGSVTAGKLSAGIWSGKFNFNISLKDKQTGSLIKVEAKNESGEDLKATASEIVGTEKDELLNSLVETGMITSAEEVNALIEVNSDDFDGLAETTFDVSSIAEEGDKVVLLHFNEETNEWEYVSTETVDSEGKITADFSSYSPVAFVKVNEDGSYSDHEHVYASTVTKEATCGVAGVKTFTCYCGDSYTEEIPATGHVWNTEYTVDKEATCQEKGMKSIHCSVCKISREGTEIEIPMTEHNYVNGVCETCGDKREAGLYDASGTMLCSWEDSGIDVETDYAYATFKETATTPYYVLTNVYPTATSVLIPEGVTTIGMNTFYGCTNLTHVNLPDSVTTIKSQAFEGCTGLTTINIPDSVTTLGGFMNCSSLLSIDIPDGITNILNDSFNGCTSLTSVIIPDSVISIGNWAFYECRNLCTINYKGSEGKWNTISKGSYWNSYCPSDMQIIYNYTESN